VRTDFRNSSLSVQGARVERFIFDCGRGAARWAVWVLWCARAPGRISVHDPAVWRAGEVMVDGVISAGWGCAAARSLEAVHAGVAAGRCREPAAVHRCE
jgi:hypothetical protein